MVHTIGHAAKKSKNTAAGMDNMSCHTPSMRIRAARAMTFWSKFRPLTKLRCSLRACPDTSLVSALLTPSGRATAAFCTGRMNRGDHWGSGDPAGSGNSVGHGDPMSSGDHMGCGDLIVKRV